MLASGQICLAMDYSGDVVQAASRAREAKQAAVQYVLPKEFTQLSFDMLAVPKDAPHPDAALFINFILQPENMAAITNKVALSERGPGEPAVIQEALRRTRTCIPPARCWRARSSRRPGRRQAADRARTGCGRGSRPGR